LKMAGRLQPADRVRLFACRVDVWHLGVAAQMVRTIEYGQPPDVWSHAAYGLLALLIPYFEMVGQIVNPAAPTMGVRAKSNLAQDFDCGFRDVYAELTTTSGDSYDPLEFYDLVRHGLYARGSMQDGLRMHNARSVSTQDFDIIQKNPSDPTTRKLYVNPHAAVRTVIDHFPTLIARLNDPAAEYEGMRTRFRYFFGDVGEG
jgi:hypothetical protein